MRLEVGQTYISPAGNKRKIVAITNSMVTYELTDAGADSPRATHTIHQRWFTEINEVD